MTDQPTSESGSSHHTVLSSPGSPGSPPSSSTTPTSSRSSSAVPYRASPLDGAAKIASNLSNYLALGCLCFEDFLSSDFDQGQSVWQDVTSIPVLPLSATVDSNLSSLINHGWVRVTSSRCTAQSQWIIYRVYVLFNDVGLAFFDRSNKRLMAALESVVREVNTEPQVWAGHYAPGRTTSFDMWATRDEDNPSLFYLFNRLPSPAPSPRDVREKYDREALEDLLELGPETTLTGLKTTLYPYQRRSAGAMLYREAVSRFELDPRLEKRHSPDGSYFYYSPHDFQFLRDPRYQELCKGGILAETMGLGKTVICLSLILATKELPPKMPAEYTIVPTRPVVGSLADMAISAINRKSIPWAVEFDRIANATGEEMDSCAARLAANPASYDIPIEPVRWNRKTTVPQPRHILMASTTLIVVPQNLCKQWSAEISKHVHPGVLKLLLMDDRKKLLPVPEELRTYDIVLFTRNRFDMEIQDGQDSEGRRMSSRPLGCRCPYKGATRDRDCRCLKDNDLYSSPLKQLHFKRLIVDEGHFFSSGSNSSTILVANRLVKADHRWVVSGTPAKNLLGVEVDLQSPEANRKNLLEQRRFFDNKHDRVGAIDSLTALASNFLHCTPFSANEGKNYIYRHEDLRDRTYSGFATGMRRLLESIVVKTRPEDVERDIVLPPCSHDVILLQPSFYDKLTANLFTLVLTANAVTSERTDADYLFHKNSQKPRLQLIANLRQSAFFWSGFSEADVQASIGTSAGYLEKEDSGCTPQDRQLLEEVLKCTEQILASKGWRLMSRSHELGVFVDQWPVESAEHWSFDDCRRPLLTGISQLLEAQKYVNTRLALEDPGEGLSGAGLRSLLPTRQASVKADEPNSPSKVKTEKPVLAKTGVPASSISGEPLLRRRSSMSSRKASSAMDSGKTSSLEITLGISQHHQGSFAAHESTINVDEMSGFPALPKDSVYAQTKVVGTSSAKLSYLLSQILEYNEDEKILVFYSGDNAAYYISQCLELFHIKHEIYAKSLAANLKSEYVVRFQEQADLRVLLMDVGQAAFGLNLCAASRVYFVNPVCRPTVEAQAVKRAHRIGQTRKVTVETLVLKDSIEEKMLERSRSMTTAEHLDAKVFEEESSVRQIIQSARILPLSAEEEQPGMAQMAPIPAQQVWNRPRCLESLVSPSRSRKRKREEAEDIGPSSASKSKAPNRAISTHLQIQIGRNNSCRSSISSIIAEADDSNDESLWERRARGSSALALIGSKDPVLPAVMGHETLAAVTTIANATPSSSTSPKSFSAVPMLHG